MTWTPDLKGGGDLKAGGPIYLAIADAIGRDVRSGALATGDQLPSQRELAERLGVDLTTVTRGYAQAAARGLIESEGRRGSFVRARTPSSPAADNAGQEVASGMNMPPEPEGVIRDAILAGTKAIFETGSAPIHYQPSGGTEADRAEAAKFLSRLIPDTQADQMLITAGAQNALHAVCGAVLQRGDRVAAGTFAYPGFLAIARRIGCEVVPIAGDEEGMVPEALEKAAVAGRLTAIYVVPTNDNPTTATMGPGRRRAIADLARRIGAAIIEDDAYGRLPEIPLPPIASLAPEISWHIASFSKIVSPSLRVGYLRAPNVRQALALAGDLHETAIMAPPINVALISRWIREGILPKLVSAVRREAVLRRKAAEEALASHTILYHPEGYHLWLPLPAGVDASGLAAQAIAAGLPVAPSASFSVEPEGAGLFGNGVGPRPGQALRVSLGGSRARDHITREIRRLDALIGQATRRDHVLV